MSEKKEPATHATDPVYAQPECRREFHFHSIDIAMPDDDGLKRVGWCIVHVLWAIFAALVVIGILSVVSRPAHGADVQVHPIAVPDPANVVETCIAHAAKHHEPCYILVGASWCNPCHRVERLYVPWLRTHGTYLHLDRDLHPGPVRRLGIAIAGLPTLIVIEGGKRRVLVGVEQIRLFIEGK